MNDLVELISISPRILLDIRYATVNNFTGKVVYSSSRCFLRRKAAERLHRVQGALEKENLGLKVYDGYRPPSAQRKFWKWVPDPRYVADPAVGSNHSRGASVDLTLVNGRGEELLMPTLFDDFSEKAALNYAGGSKEALVNRDRLNRAMVKEGFVPCESEWWHFDDPEWKNDPLLDVEIEDLLVSPLR